MIVADLSTEFLAHVVIPEACQMWIVYSGLLWCQAFNKTRCCGGTRGSHRSRGGCGHCGCGNRRSPGGCGGRGNHCTGFLLVHLGLFMRHIY